MKRFFTDMKKYTRYTLYAAKSDLKSEVANSRLSCLWWVLEPTCFMLVYSFIVKIIFSSREPNFPVFVFIGLTFWDFFNKTVQSSVRIVSLHRGLVSKVYLPKYVLVFERMGVLGFKMMISFALTLILMAFYQVRITPYALMIVPIFLVLGMVTFGVATILMHFGVFVEDLANVMNIVLRLIFYMSGIFYSIEGRLGTGLVEKLILRGNPMAFLIAQGRRVLLYGTAPEWKYLAFWFVAGILLSVIGVRTIYKYENSYAKVI